MAKLKIKVIKPTGIVLTEEGDQVILPGSEGDFGVLIGHTTFITKLRPGVIELFSGKNKNQYAIHDGFVTVENDEITIVTDTFETESMIDKDRAIHAKERAEKRLKDVNNKEIDFNRANFALKRSVARITTITKAD